MLFRSGLAFSEDTQVVASTTLAGTVAGATTAVLASRVGEVSEGQAAIVNSGVLWGTISGLLFTQVFAATLGERPVLPFVGTPFLLAAMLLAGSLGLMAWTTGRRQFGVR